MGKIRMHASKPNYHINMIISEDLHNICIFCWKILPCWHLLYIVHILNGITPRSELEVGPTRPMGKPPQSPSDILSITSFPQFLFFLTSHQIDLALALSHLVRDGRWPIPCPSGTKLATRAGRNLEIQPLLRVAIIVLEQEINLNVVASSALVRLWVCGCTEAVSPSECQCGPQVWRPSWAMGASSNLPTDAEAATPGSSRFPRTTTPSIPPTCISGKPTRKGIYERFAGEFWWTPVRFMLHGTETG